MNGLNVRHGKLVAGMLLGLALTVVAGCGGQKPKVTGKVSYKGTPLVNGTVTFHPKAGDRAAGATIQADGTYRIDDAPLGDVTITVATVRPAATPAMPPGTPGADRMGPPPSAGKYVAIPPTYKDPAASGLTYTVTPGEQKHDIDLK